MELNTGKTDVTIVQQCYMLRDSTVASCNELQLISEIEVYAICFSLL